MLHDARLGPKGRPIPMVLLAQKHDSRVTDRRVQSLKARGSAEAQRLGRRGQALRFLPFEHVWPTIPRT